MDTLLLHPDFLIDLIVLAIISLAMISLYRNRK